MRRKYKDKSKKKRHEEEEINRRYKNGVKGETIWIYRKNAKPGYTRYNERIEKMKCLKNVGR